MQCDNSAFYHPIHRILSLGSQKYQDIRFPLLTILHITWRTYSLWIKYLVSLTLYLTCILYIARKKETSIYCMFSGWGKNELMLLFILLSGRGNELIYCRFEFTLGTETTTVVLTVRRDAFVSRRLLKDILLLTN